MLCVRSNGAEMTKNQTPAVECIDPDDAPELTDEAMDRAIYKVGGKVVSREEWRIAAKAELIRMGAQTSSPEPSAAQIPSAPLTPDQKTGIAAPPSECRCNSDLGQCPIHNPKEPT
jgi:hypothetical protein